ncbi:MAG: ribosomal RNA small subunit methyltransferase A [bacterium]|nr:ribosomal RNA small subunit methyltransferase A [bacterium]
MTRIRDALAQRGLAPSKSRGQNFLHSSATAKRIVELTELCSDDAAIEIGPGLGQLTRPIAEVVRRLIAIEVDRGMVAALRDDGLPANTEIRHEDALKADLGGMVRELGSPVVLLGNLPYNISGRLLGALLGPRNPFRRWGFMVQAEVADRLLAEPGTRNYGTLSVWTRLFSRAHRVMELGPDDFVPRPNVRSTFLLFDPTEEPVEIESLPVLRAVVRAAFQQRRKTLRRALKGKVEGSDAGLERVEIDPQRRGETLSEHEFLALANAIHRAGND